jgi:ADP-ribose pyrophosphatase YjhB (NUDIX family)
MSENIKLFVAVKAFILNEKGEVLLLREASTYSDGTNIGKYDIPGGRIEIKESLEEALSREVLEETGLTIRHGELFDAHDTFNEKGGETWHIVRLFYKVSCNKEEVVISSDHDEYTWIPVKEAIKKNGLIQSLIPLLEKLV